MMKMTVEEYINRLILRNAGPNADISAVSEATEKVVLAAEKKGIALVTVMQATHDLNVIILEVLQEVRLRQFTDPKVDERIVVYPNGGVQIQDRIGPGDRGGPGSGSSNFDRAKEKSEPGVESVEKPTKPAETLIDAELNEDDLKTLKDIALRDKVVGNILNDQVWAAELSEALKKVTPGILKIAVVIADSQIDAWGKINRELGNLKESKTCTDMNARETEAIGDNREGAARFWNVMQRARGC